MRTRGECGHCMDKGEKELIYVTLCGRVLKTEPKKLEGFCNVIIHV